MFLLARQEQLCVILKTSSCPPIRELSYNLLIATWLSIKIQTCFFFSLCCFRCSKALQTAYSFTSIISIQGPKFQFVAYLILFLSPILHIVVIFNLLSLEPSVQYISTRSHSRDSCRLSTSLKCFYIASSLLPFEIKKDAEIGGRQLYSRVLHAYLSRPLPQFSSNSPRPLGPWAQGGFLQAVGFATT